MSRPHFDAYLNLLFSSLCCPCPLFVSLLFKNPPATPAVVRRLLSSNLMYNITWYRPVLESRTCLVLERRDIDGGWLRRMNRDAQAGPLAKSPVAPPFCSNIQSVLCGQLKENHLTSGPPGTQYTHSTPLSRLKNHAETYFRYECTSMMPMSPLHRRMEGISGTWHDTLWISTRAGGDTASGSLPAALSGVEVGGHHPPLSKPSGTLREAPITIILRRQLMPSPV